MESSKEQIPLFYNESIQILQHALIALSKLIYDRSMEFCSVRNSKATLKKFDWSIILQLLLLHFHEERGPIYFGGED